MSTSKPPVPMPENAEERRRIRAQYRELVTRGLTSVQAARKLGYTKYTIYRMFVLDNDPWRAHYSPYDCINAIIKIKGMMEKEGLTADQACLEVGIPFYKYQKWVEKYGPNPTLPPEPQNRVVARTVKPRFWKQKPSVKRAKKIAAAAKKSEVKKEIGLLGSLVQGMKIQTERITKMEEDFKKLMTLLGIEEIEEG